MSAETASPIGLFERYLSLWVSLCIVSGVGLGIALPNLFEVIAGIEYASVNLVVGSFRRAARRDSIGGGLCSAQGFGRVRG